MIKATELRIGNYFTREIATSRGMEYDHFFLLNEMWMGKLFGDSPAIALQDLFGIPLSPEILEKAGFERKGEYFEQNCVLIFADGYEQFYHINNAFHTHIDHVHTLQNWWQSNTAEELIINL